MYQGIRVVVVRRISICLNVTNTCWYNRLVVVNARNCNNSKYLQQVQFCLVIYTYTPVFTQKRDVYPWLAIILDSSALVTTHWRLAACPDINKNADEEKWMSWGYICSSYLTDICGRFAKKLFETLRNFSIYFKTGLIQATDDVHISLDLASCKTDFNLLKKIEYWWRLFFILMSKYLIYYLINPIT